jgi:hypothetical protein
MRAVAASRGVVYEPWGRSSRPGDPSTPTGPFPGGLKWPPRRSLWCWMTRTKTLSPRLTWIRPGPWPGDQRRANTAF